jgi:uncharacterized delta-60 repeat protein
MILDSMTRRWFCLLTCTATAGAIGCQSLVGIEETIVEDSGIEGDFLFTSASPVVSIPLNGTSTIEVEIQRLNGFAADILIRVANAPEGLIAPEIVVPGDRSISRFIVGARSPLVIGDSLTFSLEASSSNGLRKTVVVENAPVTGRPGLLDATFGDNSTGYRAIAFGTDESGGFFDMQSDVEGNLTAVGWGIGQQGDVRFAITRLSPSGGLDAMFAGGELVRTDFDSGSPSENAQAVAGGYQPDGRFVAIGWHSVGASIPPDIGLVQVGTDGSVGDAGFGNNGKSLIDLGGEERVNDGLVLTDGSILIAGEQDGRLLLAKATPAGALDGSFASPDGFQILSSGSSSAALAIAVDEQNRILVSGFVENNEQSDMVILRYTQDGELDTTFGNDGQVVAGSASVDERAVSIALQPDGKIIVAGDSNANGNVDFEVRRFDSNGAVDATFGTMGVATHPLHSEDDIAEDMVIFPDGRILVAGNKTIDGKTAPVLARYDRDGMLDPHFGINGFVELYIGENGIIHAIGPSESNRVTIGGGNAAVSPGPGTTGIVLRLWL